MSHKTHANQFTKFLEYVVGRRPDEFGLIPDHDGFLKTKDLIRAINEEDGWRHIRLVHIHEVFLKDPDPPFEITESLIRAKNRDLLSGYKPCENPPKLLYGWIRKKAYPTVFQNGLIPSAHPFVLLTKEKDFALRLGRRMDQEPIILTVMVQNCLDNGMTFQEYGDLFLSDFIPVDCFTGPPIPKEREKAKSKEKPAQKPSDQAGSFFLNMENALEKDKSFKKKGKHEGPSWKQDRKRVRQEKERY
ncbi:MAG: RNA 2'-phosphotransferase [Proteobacteria bacterium]|nr:RNA 2'-phosphotransferase [Pseudomonadota bacterium]